MTSVSHSHINRRYNAKYHATSLCMKTISTAEYLGTEYLATFDFSNMSNRIRIGRTYAAVAASVSNGLAIVTLCINPKKTTTKAVIIANLLSVELTLFKIHSGTININSPTRQITVVTNPSSRSLRSKYIVFGS
jgi:hypothetical protein